MPVDFLLLDIMPALQFSAVNQTLDARDQELQKRRHGRRRRRSEILYQSISNTNNNNINNREKRILIFINLLFIFISRLTTTLQNEIKRKGREERRR